MRTTETDAFEIEFYERVSKRNPSDLDALELLAALYSKYGEIQKTLRIDRKLAKCKPDDSRYRYNFACSLCALGRKTEALAILSQAIELGYDDLLWLQKDPDLKAIRSHPEFQKIVAELESSQSANR